MHTVCISHAEWHAQQQQRADALGSMGGPRACGSSAVVVGAGMPQDRAGKPQLARWLLHGRPDKLSLLNQQLCCSEALAESSASGRSSGSQGDGSGRADVAAGPRSAPAASASSGGNSSGSTCSIVKRLRTSRLAGPQPGTAAGDDSACGGSQDAGQHVLGDLGLTYEASQSASQGQADAGLAEPGRQEAPAGAGGCAGADPAAPDAASDSRMLTRSRKRMHAMLLLQQQQQQAGAAGQPVPAEQVQGPALQQPAALPCMRLSPAAVRLVAAAVLDAPLPYIIGTSTPVHGWFQVRSCGVSGQACRHEPCCTSQQWAACLAAHTHVDSPAPPRRPAVLPGLWEQDGAHPRHCGPRGGPVP